MKRFKLMADVFAGGLWDGAMAITLEDVICRDEPDLKQELEAWQKRYDMQYDEHTYEFDWDGFNLEGMKLLEKIKAKAPADVEIFYQPVDDREFL